MISASPRSEENKIFIGVDTSCYTSSAACVCIGGVVNDLRTPLAVPHAARGLRQSDGVFLHTRNMDELLPRLIEGLEGRRVCGVGVSTCPSGREGSYMPVFLVGKLAADTLGAALRVPVLGFTHQQGHIRAALAGNEALIGKRFFAFHLSGGTSELLLVDEAMSIRRVGGTTDISAGKLVDRLGVRMGLSFPCGPALERLAGRANGAELLSPLPSSVKGLGFSFSGAETKLMRALDSGLEHGAAAYSIYDLIARTLAKLIKNALAEGEGELKDPPRDFLFSGGVASSGLLRTLLEKRLNGSGATLHFSKPELASDNAVGTALLAMDALHRE